MFFILFFTCDYGVGRPLVLTGLATQSPNLKSILCYEVRFSYKWRYKCQFWCFSTCDFSRPEPRRKLRFHMPFGSTAAHHILKFGEKRAIDHRVINVFVITVCFSVSAVSSAGGDYLLTSKPCTALHFSSQ